jgi:hypothetical protein
MSQIFLLIDLNPFLACLCLHKSWSSKELIYVISPPSSFSMPLKSCWLNHFLISITRLFLPASFKFLCLKSYIYIKAPSFTISMYFVREAFLQYFPFGSKIANYCFSGGACSYLMDVMIIVPSALFIVYRYCGSLSIREIESRSLI